MKDLELENCLLRCALERLEQMLNDVIDSRVLKKMRDIVDDALRRE